MENMEYNGIDDELAVENAVAPAGGTDAAKKRAPYAVWTVAGGDYKLKLTASAITKLEQRYKRNLLLLVTDDGLPPLSVMLTIFQAAMQAYHHGATYQKVSALFDQYVDDGGDQQALMADVMVPLLAVSGFFTTTQADAMTKELKEMDTNL